MQNNFFDNNTYKTFLDSLPIATVDIVILNSDKNKTLLFKRTNPPAKEIFYTCGGRLRKNEGLKECAVRQLKTELGIDAQEKELFLGGVQNEIFNDSIFPGVSAHCINIYFGLMLDDSKNIVLDKQHDKMAWFHLDDESLHGYVKEKISNTVKKI